MITLSATENLYLITFNVSHIQEFRLSSPDIILVVQRRRFRGGFAYRYQVGAITNTIQIPKQMLSMYAPDDIAPYIKREQWSPYLSAKRINEQLEKYHCYVRVPR